MERMNTLDAELLHLEDGIAHMHIGGVCVFADPPPSLEEITAVLYESGPGSHSLHRG